MGTIGIISGSGPEAGLDLWQKVLVGHRARLGAGYRGDIDAPRVVMMSEPDLGYSMELAEHHEIVRKKLLATARTLAEHVDAYAVACNTLNLYAPELAVSIPDAALVSVQGVVDAFIAGRGLDRVGLLGAAPVVELGDWSAYRDLSERIEVVVPDDAAPLHRLIHDIKLAGRATPELTVRLRRIVEGLGAAPVLLACTELPLVASADWGIETVDVTALLAEALVDTAVAPRPQEAGAAS